MINRASRLRQREGEGKRTFGGNLESSYDPSTPLTENDLSRPFIWAGLDYKPLTENDFKWTKNEKKNQ